MKKIRQFLINNLMYNYIFRTNLGYLIALYMAIFLPFLVTISLWFLPVSLTILLYGGLTEIYRKDRMFSHVVSRTRIASLVTASLVLSLLNIGRYEGLIIFIGSIIILGITIAPRVLKPSFDELQDPSQQWEHGKTLSNLPKGKVRQWDYLDRYYKKNHKLK